MEILRSLWFDFKTDYKEKGNVEKALNTSKSSEDVQLSHFDFLQFIFNYKRPQRQILQSSAAIIWHTLKILQPAYKEITKMIGNSQ